MDEVELIRAASEARQEAYAPYSGFRVGAAVICDDGRIFAGANVENAVYGLSICAERVAMSKAVSEGCRRFEALAIIADGPTPCPPCGACRQFLAEFGAESLVIMANTKGETKKALIKELLPYAFTNERLFADKG
ncbi:MAG: cytidine deaminase [Candidatus Aquicultor primus]|uniref:Cytidine deaminase n=1 Tax=Candidatus Aquicultor primus TaxID=1797195 RepID=A0A1F2UH00_9ACTN|nr:MAG: cytidine deaminase [Candidatus Aquicultor primus]HCG99626.1 cytidine deaminase [Actinomycetota bacterium]